MTTTEFTRSIYVESPLAFGLAGKGVVNRVPRVWESNE